MATRKEIRDALVSQAGVLINIKQLAECTGWKRDKVREFVHDLPCVTKGRDKSFFASDIAKKLDEAQRFAIH